MITTKQEENNMNLSDSLDKCKKYAKRGYSLANGAMSLLNSVVNSASKKLQDEIIILKNNNYYNESVSNNLISQLTDIQSNFAILPQRLTEDINSLSKKAFSITLFGRTMTGKSTLMEILTHGEGNSIGQGAQRTTLDVRTYLYKNMQITDVPGIAAFDGNDDEAVAFDAAKKSDMILFLITDDAPQASEAECLNRILGLGKPVICLINVKANIDSPDDIKSFKYDLKKAFNEVRLETIKQLLISFGSTYGQEWDTLRFAYVHLKSAFLSQQKKYVDLSNELFYLSRFSYVDNLITSEVCKKGCFYKLKAFFDIVVVPITDAFDTLFSQSANNSKQGSILVTKREKLKIWTDKFEEKCNQEIESFLKNITSKLKGEIATFAEDNYDNPDASDEWNKIMKDQMIEKQVSDLLKKLGKECEAELKEISREINSEINFSCSVFFDSTINMRPLINGKRIWNWTTQILGGGLIIASLFNIWNPIGWIGLGVSVIGWLGSFFFGDHDRKKIEARRKLEKKLSSSIDILSKNLKTKMVRAVNEELMKKQLYPMCKNIDMFVNSVFLLSQTQRDLAISLNKKLQEMNFELVKEALLYLGYDGLEKSVLGVARIPGYSTMLILEYGTVFPNDAAKGLSELFKEKVRYIIKNNSIKSMLLQAVWSKEKRKNIDVRKISIQFIDNEPRIAHIPFIEEVDANTQNRIRMAQQITELLIIK